MAQISKRHQEQMRDSLEALRKRAYSTAPELGGALTGAENAWLDAMNRRSVDNPCFACHGYGVKTYGSTSIWRGGIGGQAMTPGICNACWGSGDPDRPWMNLKVAEANPLMQIAMGTGGSRVDRRIKLLKDAQKMLALDLRALVGETLEKS